MNQEHLMRSITNPKTLAYLGMQGGVAFVMRPHAPGTPAVTLVWDEHGSLITAAGQAGDHILSLAIEQGSSPIETAAPAPAAWPGAQTIDDTAPRADETPQTWWSRVAPSHGWAEWLASTGLTSANWADWAKLAAVVSPDAITQALQEKLNEHRHVSAAGTVEPAPASAGTVPDGGVPQHNG